MIRTLVGLGSLLAVLLCLGYLGQVHPAFDAIAIGRKVAVVGVIICAFGLLLLSGCVGLAWVSL